MQPSQEQNKGQSPSRQPTFIQHLSQAESDFMQQWDIDGAIKLHMMQHDALGVSADSDTIYSYFERYSSFYPCMQGQLDTEEGQEEFRERIQECRESLAEFKEKVKEALILDGYEDSQGFRIIYGESSS